MLRDEFLIDLYNGSRFGTESTIEHVDVAKSFTDCGSTGGI